VFAPERVTTNLTLARDGGSLRATWCGEKRRYEPITPPAVSPDGFVGEYANAATGLSATVGAEGGRMRLAIGARYGLHRLHLRPLDHDMVAGLPEDAPPGDAWVCTLRRDGGDLVLTTDRTKALRLRRVA
jgi:fermentation-respiration switch protein FrsA (DUF1100 family)